MGGYGAIYPVHLRLIGKLVGDFLLVIIELFLLGAYGSKIRKTTLHTMQCGKNSAGFLVM